MEVSRGTSVMAELHGTARTSFGRDALVVNVRHALSERCIWIGSLGHEVRAPEHDALALVGYCGLQVIY